MTEPAPNQSNSPTAEDTSAHLRWLQSEIEWNKKQVDGVGRDRQRAPFLLLGFVAAIPVGIMFDWFKAILVCVGSIALLISALYLTGVHRSQYLQKIADLEKQLKAVERKRF